MSADSKVKMQAALDAKRAAKDEKATKKAGAKADGLLFEAKGLNSDGNPTRIRVFSDRIEECNWGLFKKGVRTIPMDQVAGVSQDRGPALSTFIVETAGGGTIKSERIFNSKALAATELITRLSVAARKDARG